MSVDFPGGLGGGWPWPQQEKTAPGWTVQETKTGHVFLVGPLGQTYIWKGDMWHKVAGGPL